MDPGETIHPGLTWSVIIPFFNEEDGVSVLLEEVGEAVDLLADVTGDPPHALCEVLLVNDGSTDRTGALLARACALRAGWRTIELARNYGQATALYIGIRMAKGKRLVLLDGDGQNDPADIPQLLTLLDAGADLAIGVRAKRCDNWRRRTMSRLANAVRQRLLRDGVCDTGCGLKAMRREVVDSLVPIRTLYSFIPALVAGAGFRVAETPVRHRARRGGESKYGVRRFLFWPLLDMLGVWWLTHRRCPPSRIIHSPANIIVLPPIRPLSEVAKA